MDKCRDQRFQELAKVISKLKVRNGAQQGNKGVDLPCCLLFCKVNSTKTTFNMKRTKKQDVDLTQGHPGFI